MTGVCSSFYLPLNHLHSAGWAGWRGWAWVLEHNAHGVVGTQLSKKRLECLPHLSERVTLPDGKAEQREPRGLESPLDKLISLLSVGPFVTAVVEFNAAKRGCTARVTKNEIDVFRADAVEGALPRALRESPANINEVGEAHLTQDAGFIANHFLENT